MWGICAMTPEETIGHAMRDAAIHENVWYGP